MKWVILAVLQWTASIFCMITTPLVVRLCDEEGELDGIFHLWQPWDDSCYAEQMATESAPKFLQYDWHSKYYTVERDIPGTGRARRYAVKYPWATFSLKERIQRYCCAVLWLWRNPAYGFAFYVFGRNVDTSKMIWITVDDKHRLGYDREDKSWNTAWCIKDDRWISKHIRKSWYLGWKIPQGSNGVVRCMIAARLSFRFKKEE